MKISLLDSAEQDLLKGFWFYETQKPGLGDYFLDSIYSDIESLYLYAGVHSLEFGYHRLLCKRFPFAIYYKYIPAKRHIDVYAILDCRSNPINLTRRLGK